MIMSRVGNGGTVGGRVTYAFADSKEEVIGLMVEKVKTELKKENDFQYCALEIHREYIKKYLELEELRTAEEIPDGALGNSGSDYFYRG